MEYLPDLICSLDHQILNHAFIYRVLPPKSFILDILQYFTCISNQNM